MRCSLKRCDWLGIAYWQRARKVQGSRTKRDALRRQSESCALEVPTVTGEAVASNRSGKVNYAAR